MSTAVLPGKLEQAVSLGPEDQLQAVWRLECSFGYCIRPFFFHHPQHQTQLRALSWEWGMWRWSSRPGVGRRD